ncbi:MAG: exopolysaccharide biosynthesis protein [Alphaproteobacteria bacterium]|nr:exopolysaccharide biosynthesis protein [Alphaproteobacteria bacterium]
MTIRSLSDLLKDLAEHVKNTGDMLTLKDLIEAFHERGFGFFLFLFALPAALPLPGLGINAIIALPLLLLTAQQAIGRHSIWVPHKLAQKSLKSETINNFITSATPWVKRIEFFIGPRLGFVTQGIFSRLIGFLGFVMALAVSIPLPLTNTVPAFGIALMAIGVLMRDGLAVISGAIIGIFWIGLLSWAVITFGPEGIDLIKDFIKSFFA